LNKESTMKALVYNGPRDVSVESMPDALIHSRRMPASSLMSRLHCLAACLAVAAVAACGNTAKLPVSAGIGANPKLPPPEESMMPTVNIAPAKGWPAGGKPVTAAGTSVAAFAIGLDHPRWLHVLPNGDVLVAETNAPERPLRKELLGIRGWYRAPTASRCCATPTATASPRCARCSWRT
jgi:glucose/arabinose dehydrogenase